MQTASPEEPDSELPPPGARWGSGASSVLPYLTRSLQARPAPAQEQRESRTGERDQVFTNTPPPTR